MLTKNFRPKVVASIMAAILIASLSIASHAAGTHGGGHGTMSTVGEQGKSEEVSRTIEIEMFDNYYDPEVIQLKAGETVRFVVKNQGQLVHEFNIGTPDMHTAHQEEMMMMVQHGALMPDHINHEKMAMDMGGGKTMEHNDPNSVLLEPGKSAEVIWRFAKAGELEFACNVPGHYDAGMVGMIQTN
jgi:uncharacterized cupredoxin-like copper-binding protein